MEKKSIIPDVPEDFRIPEELQNKYDEWVQYFKNLSDRIIIRLPSDKSFDYTTLELQTKRLIAQNGPNVKDIVLDDWPKLEQIAFYICYDSSLAGQEKQYLAKDVYVFCFGDIAFGLDYYESVEDSDRFNKYHYDLEQYTNSALCWKYIAKIVRSHIEDIQNQIKSQPPTPDEKLHSSEND